uniref:Secreted LysM effector Lys4 n=1 Tax=Pochonia chlamydosporia (strain 123) TaxID=1052797 RepID=LYSM4_POCC1
MRALTAAVLFVAGLTPVLAQDSSPTGPTFPNTVANCNAWYTIVKGDGCDTVEKKFKITPEQFFKWNPDVSTDCVKNFWVGNSYCVGVGKVVSSSKTSTTVKSSSTTQKTSSTSSKLSSSSKPVNTTTTPYSTRNPVTSYNLTQPYTATSLPPAKTQSGQPAYCNQWHWVGTGDTCLTILNLYGSRLTQEQLIIQHSEATALARTSYSVPWTSSQGNATVPAPTDYTPPVKTIVANFTASPQMTGVPQSCQNFYQAQDGDTCDVILKQFDYISREQFFSWNPALQGNCNGLWVGYYYCVANFATGVIPMPPTVTKVPDGAPTAINTCNKWYQAVGNDDCDAITTYFGTFSKSDFIKWNPSVYQDCSGLKTDSWYCVGIPGTPTTRTKPLTTTSLGSLPTQTGISASCKQYWLVSPSDTCASIISNAGVSADDFYKWNPALGGSACKGLQPNYYVCVSLTAAPTDSGSTTTITGPPTKGSNPPTTTTSGGGGGTIQTPSPIMPGMIGGCVRFWFRGKDGASLFCADIAKDAGVSLPDFLKWNPGVGSNCESLWADTWYCVGVSGKPTTMSSGIPTPASK